MSEQESNSAATGRIPEIRDTPGRWLYHYTTLEVALAYFLPSLRLRLSPFANMRKRESMEWSPAGGDFGESQQDDVDIWQEATRRLNSRLELADALPARFQSCTGRLRGLALRPSADLSLRRCAAGP